jgi:hypothetical protein
VGKPEPFNAYQFDPQEIHRLGASCRQGFNAGFTNNINDLSALPTESGDTITTKLLSI